MTDKKYTPVNVYGLRRSGLHALVNWIKSHTPGATFANDVMFARNAPAPMHPKVLEKDIRLYENPPIAKVEAYMANNLAERHVTIMRDPYNWAASYFKKWPQFLNVGQYTNYITKFYNKSWPAGTVYVNYNKWVQSPEYRIEIAAEIGFETDGEPHQHVASWGDGSSFDGVRFGGKAQNMNLFARYGRYLTDPKFLKLELWNDNIFDKAKAIFDLEPHPILVANKKD